MAVELIPNQLKSNLGPCENYTAKMFNASVYFIQDLYFICLIPFCNQSDQYLIKGRNAEIAIEIINVLPCVFLQNDCRIRIIVVDTTDENCPCMFLEYINEPTIQFIEPAIIFQQVSRVPMKIF
ncbi:MAG: hypothetical protein BGN96_00860 [Bacteroidales bacterium 45-6]|nr:MAG: hypothetical protein BGN96_00860 [Bacteroidales bacterium 45-6]